MDLDTFNGLWNPEIEQNLWEVQKNERLFEEKMPKSA